MTVKEILVAYPGVTTEIKEWYLEQMLQVLDNTDFSEDFKNAVKEMGIDDDKIERMIQSSPRGTFDFFDKHEIYIVIDVSTNPLQFEYVPKQGSLIERRNTRIEAELAGVEHAFKLLNEQL